MSLKSSDVRVKRMFLLKIINRDLATIKVTIDYMCFF